MKQLYVFDYITNLTSRYHSGGGLVIIAATRAEAEEKFNNVASTNDEPVFDTNWWSDLSLEVPVEANEDKVFIFPDLGCC